MWLIIKVDNKIEYMLEVFDTETLQSITEKIQQMHPISHGEIQYIQTKGGSPLPLDKSLIELGLKNHDILFIDPLKNLNSQRIPKRSSSNQIASKRENIFRTKSSGP